MRSLLTGYAGIFNRRHRRSGHLFQNRYKSIVCEEEPYFLELIRYLHLNPLRVGVVRDLGALGRYPYIVGMRRCWGDMIMLGKIRRWCWNNLGKDPDRPERSTRDLLQTGLIEGEDLSFRGED